MNYKVLFASKAIKDLKSIPRNQQAKIIEKAESLGFDPYQRGSLKLKGLNETLFRVRVGDYRILYQVNEEVKIVDIRKIGHRRDVY